MNLEAKVAEIVGIKYKSPKVRPIPLLTFAVLSKLDHLLHKTETRGSLPSEGSAFVVINHTSMWDIAKGYDISVKSAGRIMLGIARETLLNPDLVESVVVLERTGKKNDPLTKAPKLLRRFISYVLHDTSIPIPRGAQSLSSLRPTLRATTKALNEGHIVGIFAQETRSPDFRDIKDGPAFLANLNPDVPIYPVAIFKEQGRHIVSIGQGFSANQARLDPSFRTDLDQVTALTVYIADGIANLMPDLQRNDWHNMRKQEYLQAKITPKK